MSRFALIVLAVLGLSSATPDPVSARGNMASQTTNLPPLVMAGDLSFSVKEYKIETGKYYRWTIESKGGEEFQLMAPDLFRNAWVNEVVINKIEIQAEGIYSIEFDDPGKVEITFIVTRPGRYRYFVKGFEQRGMAGTFIVE